MHPRGRTRTGQEKSSQSNVSEPSPLAWNRQRKPPDGLDPFSAVLEEVLWVELERRKGVWQLDSTGRERVSAKRLDEKGELAWGVVDGLGTGAELNGCVVYAGICKRKWKCSRDRGVSSVATEVWNRLGGAEIGERR